MSPPPPGWRPDRSHGHEREELRFEDIGMTAETVERGPRQTSTQTRRVFVRDALISLDRDDDDNFALSITRGRKSKTTSVALTLHEVRFLIAAWQPLVFTEEQSRGTEAATS